MRKNVFLMAMMMCRVGAGWLHAGSDALVPDYTPPAFDASANILAGEWKVFIRTAGAVDPAMHATELPSELTVSGQTLRAHDVVVHANHTLDFGALSPGQPERTEAWAFREVTVPSDRRITVGAGADWWMEWFVNGDPVFSTMANGNAGAVSDRRFTFELPLNAGRNIIAVRVLSGSLGWKLVCSQQQTAAFTPARFLSDMASVVDWPSECILNPCDDLNWSGSGVVMPVQDAQRGAVYELMMEAGPQKIFIAYARPVPHDGLAFYLKGHKRDTNSADHIRIQAYVQPLGPDPGADAGANAVSDGAERIYLTSGPLDLAFDGWQRITLRYDRDFFPRATASDVTGAILHAINILSELRSPSRIRMDAFRYLNAPRPHAFEIRGFMQEGHVFFRGRPFTPSLRVYSPVVQDVALTVHINRQDNRVHKTLDTTLAVHKGEQVYYPGMPALAEGYYSIVVKARADDGARFTTAGYFKIVPPRDVEAWIGDHEGAAYLYDRAELSDLYRGGYRLLRAAGYLDEVARGDAGERAWTAARAIVRQRVEMGFEVIGSQMGTGAGNIDTNEFERRRQAFQTPVRLTDWGYSFPAQDKTKIRDSMAAAAASFKGRIRYWEFGNEFDRVVYPEAEPGKFAWWGTGREYAEDLAHFYEGVKRGNPQARVISSGITCILNLPVRKRFILEMLDHCGSRHFDVFGLHGYGGQDNMAAVLGYLRERGFTQPFCCTERGYAGAGRAVMLYALKEICFLRQQGALFFISFINRCAPPDPSNHAREYATRHYDGSPGSMWALYSTAAFMLDGARDLTPITGQPYQGVRYRARDGHALLLYKEGGPCRQEFASRGSVRVIDALGNETAVNGSPFVLTLDDLPRYVVSASPIEAVGAGPMQSLPTTLAESRWTGAHRFDGSLSEWPATNRLAIDSAQQVVMGRNEWLGQVDLNSYYGTHFTTSNLSGACAFVHSGDTIVLGVQVVDDDVNVMGADATVETGDSFTLTFISHEDTRETLRLIPGDEGTVHVRGNAAYADRVTALYRRLATGYSAEVRFPQSMVQLSGNRQFRMNVTLWDADRHTGQTTDPYIGMSLGPGGTEAPLPVFVLSGE
ncbi:MAG: hypothetical protein JW951_02395 [Lentisphaerae bacterium]|nr:hypothetical protein [Lentisphaerota bacterium]